MQFCIHVEADALNAVFVYGSLMFDPVWGKVVQGSYQSFPAIALNFVRLAVPGETYPAAVPRQGASIHGMVWQDVSVRDLERLDAFEGPEYRRELIEVTPQSCTGVNEQALAPYQAWVYLWNQLELLDLSKPWDLELFKSEGLPQFLSKHVGSWEQIGTRKQ